MQEVIDQFDIKQVSRNSPKFSTDDLIRLNGKLLHEMPYSMVKDRLESEGVDEKLWDIVKGNISVLPNAYEYKEICYSVWEPVIEDPEYIAVARKLLPAAPWDENTWAQWTGAISAETGNKGKALYMPLRKALTGMEHGPEMKLLLPIIGYEKSVARLEGKRA